LVASYDPQSGNRGGTYVLFIPGSGHHTLGGLEKIKNGERKKKLKKEGKKTEYEAQRISVYGCNPGLKLNTKERTIR